MFDKELFGLDKAGGLKVWLVEAIDRGGHSELIISHGKVGGKLTRKVDIVSEGKQGRGHYEQAVLQSKAKIKKQVDKGYRETKDALEDLPLLAMLAGDYTKVGHRVVWSEGVDLSDKLDGLRMLVKCILVDGIKKVVLESRTGQTYTLPHISEALCEILSVGEVLDGEAYLHGECLEDITSAVGRTDTQKEIDKAQRKHDKALKALQATMLLMGEFPEENFAYECAVEELEHAKHIHWLRPRLKFAAFDVPSDKPWHDRIIDLALMSDRFVDGGFIWAVAYTRVFSEEEMLAYHDDAVARGYEGCMLRNRFGVYESGKRSADLQKFKRMISAEFLILDIIPAKDDGCVYILANDVNSGEFRCAYGTMFDRANALAEKQKRIGRYMTVDYQTRFKKTLLPQFGVGKLIRNGTVVNGKFVPSE